MTIIDQHTGYVKAIIGGRGTKTASLTLNRATDSTRQPGSTFKIVSTYAAALNEKGMTLATTYEDQPITYDNGAPVNNASGSFNGTTTIRTAIRNSVNTVAVQCFEDVTPELGLKYLGQLWIYYTGAWYRSGYRCQWQCLHRCQPAYSTWRSDLRC